MKKILAFSLIELMISLITISCIVAAFTPVITKKMKNSNVTISGNNVSDITTECTDKFSSSCKLCTKSYCIQCELSTCPIGQYTESKSCSCKNCSTLHSNCLECDSTKCTKCKDNNYYINNGKCENCPTNKICDGINAYDESYCTNPPTGYYCDGNNIRKCVDKYDMHCATCNSSKCLTCSGSYYLDGNTCRVCHGSCATCQNSTSCLTCGSGRLFDSNNTCTVLCSNLIENCDRCTSSTVCTHCVGGYYLNSSNKCSPCSNISNCVNCSSGSVCTRCGAGYYINSSNKCSKCNITNCASCNKDGTCSSCKQDYYLSDDKKNCIANDDKFNCSDGNFMKVGNLCVTRLNMGDSSILSIPQGVTVAKTKIDYCYTQSDRCCWKGEISATSCNDDNGGYSGCTRTVCNLAAANYICSNFRYAGKTWRLATADEMKDWEFHTFNLGANGLMLCDYAGNFGSARCQSERNCKGAVNDYCSAWRVWGQVYSETSGYSFLIGSGNVTNSRSTSYESGSVRCVTEME